jgi:hypothetical protein
MDATPARPGITVRIVRRGEQAPPREHDWAGTTIEQRIEAVWELTRLCLAWQGDDEPRLDRSVVRIRRGDPRPVPGQPDQDRGMR